MFLLRTYSLRGPEPNAPAYFSCACARETCHEPVLPRGDSQQKAMPWPASEIAFNHARNHKAAGIWEIAHDRGGISHAFSIGSEAHPPELRSLIRIYYLVLSYQKKTDQHGK